jgi:multiple sugar transport system permease protein
MRRSVRQTAEVVPFIAPFLIVFLGFIAFPVFYSLFLSTHRVTGLYDVFGGLKFVGLDNFVQLFRDRVFWWSLLMTLYYGALSIPTGIAVSLALALLLRRGLKALSFFRALFFMPYVLDLLVVSIVWTLIYAPHFGVLVRLFEFFGIHTFTEQGFLGRATTAMPAVVLVNVLKGSGFGMVLYLAAIHSIPDSVFEAADLDGAGWWDRLRLITLPLLRPITLFLAVVGTIGALNAFVEVYAMTEGGPNVDVGGKALGATWVTGYYLYRTFYVDLRLGYAAAMSIVLLILCVAISLGYRKFLGTRADA